MSELNSNHQSNYILKTLRMSLPIISFSWLGVLSSTITPRFLAKYSLHALAASALTYRAFLIVLLILGGIQMGQGVLFARRPNDQQQSFIIQSTGLIITISFFTAVFLYFMPIMLRLCHQSPVLIQQATPYFHVLAFASPLMAINGLWRQVLLNKHLAAWLYILAIIYLGCSILFNYVFILGYGPIPAMGLKGSAIAELISQLVVAIISYALICNKTTLKPLVRTNIHSYTKHWLTQWQLCWPIAARWCNEMVAMMIIVLLIGFFNTCGLGAYRLASQLDMLFLMIPYGASIATGILIAQNNDSIYIRKIQHAAQIITFVPLALASITFWLVPSTLITHIFAIQPSHICLITTASHMLMIVAIAHLFNGARQIFSGALRGMHDTLAPLIYSIICYWGIGIGCSYVAYYFFHASLITIWGIIGANYVLGCLLSGLRYRHNLYKHHL